MTNETPMTIMIADSSDYGETTAFEAEHYMYDAFASMWGAKDVEDLMACPEWRREECGIYEAAFHHTDEDGFTIYETRHGDQYRVYQFQHHMADAECVRDACWQ